MAAALAHINMRVSITNPLGLGAVVGQSDDECAIGSGFADMRGDSIRGGGWEFIDARCADGNGARGRLGGFGGSASKCNEHAGEAGQDVTR